MQPDDAISALRKALEFSPDNLPLRQHLADTLLKSGLAAQAEQEFRAALTFSRNDSRLKMGLAAAFYAQGKDGPALVVVEEVLGADDTLAEAHLLYARLLIRSEDFRRAAVEYRRAVSANRDLEDEELAQRLGPYLAEPVRVPEAVPASGAGTSGLAPAFLIEQPDLSFEDVGGMDAVKEDIQLKIVLPLRHPELSRAYRKRAGGGILMYGPPGCGKTHLARATAGEVGTGFLAVGINDILEMWLGESEQRLHDLFEHARRNRPSILFFDEVDALAASRMDMRRSAGRSLINQFLEELDGATSSNEGVLVLAATNAPWHLDPAFRRPGRFDSQIFVPPPDLDAREAILRIHCAGRLVKDVDHRHVAKRTEGYSGADLKAVVDRASDRKLLQAIKTNLPTPIETSDLLDAAGQIKPSTKEWFSAGRNYALYANQDGIYDDILKYLEGRK